MGSSHRETLLAAATPAATPAAAREPVAEMVAGATGSVRRHDAASLGAALESTAAATAADHNAPTDSSAARRAGAADAPGGSHASASIARRILTPSVPLASLGTSGAALALAPSSSALGARSRARGGTRDSRMYAYIDSPEAAR